MPKYVIHNSAGDILRVLDIPAEAIELQLQPGEFYIEGTAETHDVIDTLTMEVVRRPAPDLPRSQSVEPPPEYVVQRQRLYPPVEVQLDLLWHAMESGEIPRATDFFERIKTVKDVVPKEGAVNPVIVYTLDEIPEETQ